MKSKYFKKTLKWVGSILLIPILYFAFAFVSSWITVNNKVVENSDHLIYLNTNGVHLDLIIPENELSPSIKNHLSSPEKIPYYSFGWGDKNFYLHTPEWKDLTFKNAVIALFLKSESLMHVTDYQQKRNDWVAIPLNDSQLSKLNDYIWSSFQTEPNGNFKLLENQGYTDQDEFYEAKGSYHIFNTCNSWANRALKTSDMKASLWTPFDFILLNKYKQE